MKPPTLPLLPRTSQLKLHLRIELWLYPSVVITAYNFQQVTYTRNLVNNEHRITDDRHCLSDYSVTRESISESLLPNWHSRQMIPRHDGETTSTNKLSHRMLWPRLQWPGWRAIITSFGSFQQLSLSTSTAYTLWYQLSCDDAMTRDTIYHEFVVLQEFQHSFANQKERKQATWSTF